MSTMKQYAFRLDDAFIKLLDDHAAYLSKRTGLRLTRSDALRAILQRIVDCTPAALDRLDDHLAEQHRAAKRGGGKG